MKNLISLIIILGINLGVYAQYTAISGKVIDKAGDPLTAEGDRIPNRPYLFANGAARYLVPEVLRANDELSFFANSRYVHEFFRSWESAGQRQFKQTIPSQMAQNTGLTYKAILGATQTAFTAEVQNLTNAKVFDFFGVTTRQGLFCEANDTVLITIQTLKS